MNVLLKTNSDRLSDDLGREFRQSPEAHDLPTADLIRLSVSVKPGKSSSRSPFFRGLGHVVAARFGTDVFILDLLRRTVIAQVVEGTAEDGLAWRSVFLPILAGLLGPSVGVVPFHCACVTAHSRAFLLAGVSGAGKSTLTAAIARTGAGLVSDDWTYIHAKQDSLVAYGLQVPLKLLPDAVAFFPELARQRLTRSLNGELAYEVDPKLVLGVATRAKCSPDAIFFLQRNASSGCEVTPLAAGFVAEYFQRSFERLPPELPVAARRRHEVLDAVAGLPAFSFRYGGTPADGAASFLSAIGQIKERRAA